MKIGIASDHRGYYLKEQIKKMLDLEIEIIDYGTNNNDNVDYVEYAVLVGKAINNKEIQYGILICGTGIGMSIAANKIKGIMCAKVDNVEEAKLAKEHNNANVIAISSKNSIEESIKMIKVFINSNVLKAERYKRRVDKIKNLEYNF